MRKINFIKMVASGNDFVIVAVKSQRSLPRRQAGKVKSLSNLAKNICDRKFGIGADGLLILEKSKVVDVKMRIFNADGSEAEMCGNGARCIALYTTKNQKPKTKGQIFIETKAGIIESKVNSDKVKIKLTNPTNIKLNIPIKVNKRKLKVNFINTGVPHTVIFVEGLDKIDVVNLGRTIRYHKRFAPTGTNVDFVEVLNNDLIGIRTYERGVENETLACGTGAVASSLIFSLKVNTRNKVGVLTKSTETLKVYFDKIKNRFENVWLEGEAKIVYAGVYYV